MFQNLITTKPILPEIESNLFEKDILFNNEKILRKGIYRETITETGDSIELNKTFLSEDKSFSKIQITTLTKESFIKEINKNDLLTLSEALREQSLNKTLLDNLISSNKFEECAIIRDKLIILNKIIDIKKLKK